MLVNQSHKYVFRLRKFTFLVQALREIMGPVDPVRAKTDAPES
jgi:hypothetical protein